MKLIKIGASWCAPCNAMDALLDGFDVCELIKYDVDNDDEETLNIIDEYKIRSIPVMLLFDNDNNLVKRWDGSTTISNIMREIEKIK